MREDIENSLIDPLEGFLGYQLRRVSAAAMGDLAASLANHNLSPALAAVLLMIAANPGETQACIGRELAIKRANIAPMIAKLESEGIVTRTICDGRSYGLACTARGRVTVKIVKKVMTEHEESMFRSLNPHDQQKMMTLLIQLRHGLRSFAKQ